MFFKIEEQIFNIDNFRDFDFTDNILNLNFNGNVNIKIKQNVSDYQNFIEFIIKNDSFFVNENLGINIKNVSGISKKEEGIIVYFVDGFDKIYKDIKIEEFEKQIIGV